MERLLALEMIRVTEAAAISSARLMGRGDTTGADRVAVEAMRRTLDELPIDATIVIGEGERDSAPMLFIGERVGDRRAAGGDVPAIDIAVDPLEGTTLVSHGQANAITVLAASERAACSTPRTATWRSCASARSWRARWTWPSPPPTTCGASRPRWDGASTTSRS